MPSDLELREEFLRYAVSASIAFLAAAPASPAMAQLEGEPVRMEKAPFHIGRLSRSSGRQPPSGRNTGTPIQFP
jgi:hypothetical protein